jgi:hypothetical protein
LLEAIPYLEKQGMLSRALITATVTLLIGCITAVGVRAQENLDRGKSPSQIFSGTCSACHKSPRGLLKNVSASSLPGFLRQHYTTGSEMASLLASFLISNGAADPRYQAKDQPKQKDAKQDARPDQLDRFGRRQQPAAPATEASRPESSDRLKPQGEGGRSGRDAKRLARPTATPDANRPGDGQTPVQAATDSKQGTKQRPGKRGKPAVEEPPKADEAARGEAGKDGPSGDTAKTESSTETAKTDAAKSDVPTDAAKTEGDKPEAAKPLGDAAKPAGEASKSPAGEVKSETAKVDAPKESVGSEPVPLRPDPVPSVTPASPPSSSTGGTPEPAASPSVAAPSATPAPATPPAATATAPAAAPAGPPVPPISR